MSIKEKEELYKKALSKYGLSAQMTMVYEECSELINSLCKFNRGRCSEEDVITEIADVMIMCEQMALCFGIDRVESEKDRKLQRLREKLSN